MARMRLVDPMATVDGVARRALGVSTQAEVDATAAELQRYRDTDAARYEAPVVSGSTADGTALQSVIAALKNAGAVVDASETVEDEVVTGSIVADEITSSGDASIAGTLNVFGGANVSGNPLFAFGGLVADSNTAPLTVRDASFTQYFRVLVSSKIVGVSQGSALKFYTGDFAAITATIDGATGNATLGGTLGVTGDVAVNTNKFNVTASNGNTTVAGTLGVTGAMSAATVTSTGTSANQFDGAIVVDRTGTGAFIVRDDTPTNIFAVDTTNKDVEIRNGSTLTAYSDDGTTVQGQLDGTSGRLTARGNKNVPAYISSTSGASNAIASSNTETTFSNGSYTVPANTLTGGDMIHIRAFGTYGITATPTLTIKLKFGTTTVFNSGAITLSAAGSWLLEFFCRTHANTNFGGYGTYMIGPTNATPAIRMIPTTTALASDWSTDKAITITAQWSASSASNTVTMDRWIIQHT